MRRIVRKPSPYSVTMASAFAGVGGFELAAKSAGMAVTAWSEHDPAAGKKNPQPNQRVLHHRFPDAEGYGDIAEVSYADLGRPRVLTGGSPCQGFSIAGLRQGMLDDRSGLFAEFIRLIREGMDDGLEFAVWENVTGALSSAKGRDFANVIAAMVGADEPLHLPKAKGGRSARWSGVAMGPLGFFAWRTLDAQNFGVAQRRHRIYGVWSKSVEGAKALFGDQVADWILDNEPDVEPTGGIAVWLLDDVEDIPFGTSMEPDDPVKIRLAEVLEHDVDEKYYLSEKACLGILTRATRRDRKLPFVLHLALWIQAGCPEEFVPDVNDITEIEGLPVLMKIREGKPGGGKGALLSEDLSLTLATGNDQYLFEPVLVTARKSKRAMNSEDHETWLLTDHANTINCFDVGDIRATDVVVQIPVEVAGALQAQGGTGGFRLDVDGAAGGHVVPVIGFNGEAFTFVLQPDDRRGGKGAVASHAVDVSSALTSTELAASTDRGIRVVEVAEVPAFSIRTGDNNANGHGIAEEVTHALAESKQRQVVLSPFTYRVRRLTPRECERLQGFPDDHTLVDGASDSHRYRQMGNAVAVPCAAWVLARIRAVMDDREVPGMTEVLEELPWVRRSSVASSVSLSPMPVASAPSSNGHPKSKGISSKKVVRRKRSSSVSTPR